LLSLLKETRDETLRKTSSLEEYVGTKMKMKPTEQLKAEHDAVKLGLRILSMVCTKLESKERITVEHLDQILEFIKIFTDKYHHGKEEDLLFNVMQSEGIPREAGPIGDTMLYVALMEHYVGRDYIKDLTEALAKYRAGDRTVSSNIIQTARDYLELLTQHIEKEDNILYPMADKYLSEEAWKKLTEEFGIADQEKFGVAKQKEFYQLLDDLRRIYLE